MSNIYSTKYRFGNIISTPHEMCVHELYKGTIESSNMTWNWKQACLQ